MLKIYEKIKDFIKENYKTIIVYGIIIAIFVINLPYYISAPGGLIDTKKRILTDEAFEMKGSLNMAYVTEIHANIPTYLWSFIAKDWDLEKKEEAIAKNDNEKDMIYRNKLLLEEANVMAEKVAYQNSDIDYEIVNNKVFVTYIDEKAKTDLEVRDQIIEVDGNKVVDKNYLLSYVKSKNIGDALSFKVIDGNKEKTKKATLIDLEGEAKVGIIITETYEIKSGKKLKFDFSSSESGPSGGLMTSLAIYSNINRVDLTSGKKIAGTGTIEEGGKVGEISGVKYKLIGAVNNKADVFLVPKGENYNEAKKLKKDRGYKIDLVPIETFEQALNYLLK